jgi:glycosyl transferase family 25
MSPNMNAKPLADGVLVVNLDERQDRWDTFLADVAPALAPMAATRLSAVKGIQVPGYGAAPWFRGGKRDKTWAGRAGCTLSHRRAIEQAAAQGWRTLLILEDDVEVVQELSAILPALAQALAQTEWDICYLGYTDPVTPAKRIAALGERHALFRFYGGMTTHAYLVRESAYPLLLRELPTQETVWAWVARHRAIDRWYARRLSRHLNVLAVSPSILNQRADTSDITGRSHETAHVISIDASASAGPFPLAKMLRTLAFIVGGCVDAVRGLARRLTGF